MRIFLIKHILFFTAFSSIFLMSGCKKGTNMVKRDVQQGNPVLSCDVPVYDEETKTFNLTILTTNTAGASLSFDLIADDNIIMHNNDGIFNGIEPLEEGYKVRMNAKWKDTTIVQTIHVLGFIIPADVDKMTIEELEHLINTRDRSIRQNKNKQLAQDVKLVIKESGIPHPQILSDVITLIINGVWQGVRVVDVEYDNNNLIKTITLQPVGEQISVDEDEDFDY